MLLSVQSLQHDIANEWLEGSAMIKSFAHCDSLLVFTILWLKNGEELNIGIG